MYIFTVSIATEGTSEIRMRRSAFARGASIPMRSNTSRSFVEFSLTTMLKFSLNRLIRNELSTPQLANMPAYSQVPGFVGPSTVNVSIRLALSTWGGNRPLDLPSLMVAQPLDALGDSVYICSFGSQKIPQRSKDMYIERILRRADAVYVYTYVYIQYCTVYIRTVMYTRIYGYSTTYISIV